MLTSSHSDKVSGRKSPVRFYYSEFYKWDQLSALAAAKLTDGKFDVIGVGDLSALQLFTSAPRVYFGSHLSMPEVSHALARKVNIRPADRGAEIALEVDGELPGRLPATFQIVPEALRVRVGRTLHG